MKTSYRVRFSSKNNLQVQAPEIPPALRSGPSLDQQQTLSPSSSYPSQSRPRGRSRSGCKECKLRRVKCDETYPVCFRCQRRGSICRSSTPSTQWQVDTPWMMIVRPLAEPWTGVVNPERRLLHYWLEKTSRIMTLCPDNNPLSFPLLAHLMSTPSLLHTVQSVSAGQEHFFQASCLTTCLQERGLAIQALRREIKDPAQVKPPSVLAVFLQGVSWAWTENHPNNYGKEHLLAARTLLERLLSDPEKRNDPLVQFMLGWYLYWDMSCAFIAGPHELAPLNTAQMFDAIQTSRGTFHPMVGFSAELFYLIACLGRHCRLVMETGVKDPILEATFEGQLLAWEPEHDDENVVDMSIGYRNHGLIMLYTICGIPVPVSDISFPAEGSMTGPEDFAPWIRDLAMDSLGRLFRTPVDAPCLSFHSTPLLTAAAELTAEDAQLRNDVVNRFKAIYSTNRVAVNMWAIELLQELWGLRDCGVHVTWLELLISKEWTFTFA